MATIFDGKVCETCGDPATVAVMDHWITSRPGAYKKRIEHDVNRMHFCCLDHIRKSRCLGYADEFDRERIGFRVMQ